MDATRDDAYLQRVARRLLRDRHLAEDVAQDAWIVVLRRNGDVGQRRKFLAGVVRHLSIDALRAREHRVAREARSARPDVAPSTEDLVQRERVRGLLTASLAELPSTYETVLRLRYYRGLPPREIARELGVPVETVRTRTKRGLARLRDKLEGECGGERGAWCLALVPLAAGLRMRPTSPGLRTGRVGAARRLRPALTGWPGALTVAGVLSVAFLPGGFERGGWDAPGPGTWAAERGPGRDSFSRNAVVTRLAESPRERRSPVAAYSPLALRVVVAEDGRPLAGARVRAAWPGSETTEVADEAGHLVLELPAGEDVELTVGATVLTHELVATHRARGGPPADDAGRPGEAELTLRAPSLRFVSGRVVDGNGLPRVDARLEVWGVPDGNEKSGAPIVACVTDAAGRYVLAGLPASFRVEARAGAWRSLFALGANELPPGAFDGGELSLFRTAALAGRVVDESGVPLAGAAVHAWPECGKLRTLSGSPLFLDARLDTTTDESGRFRFGDVADVRWTLVADQPPLVSAWRNVRASEREALELQLVRGVAARMRVVDGAGRPLEGAVVSCWREFTRGADDPPVERPRVSREETTGPDGTACFEGQLGDKPLLFAARAEGYATLVRGPVRAPVELEFVLPEARALTGRLTGPAGDPVARGLVVVRPDVELAALGAGFDLFVDRIAMCGMAATDAEGRFTLAVAPDRVELLALANDGRGGLDVAALSVAPGGNDVEIVLDGQPSCAGRVVAAETGQALGGLDLTLQSTSLGVQRRLRTGDDGRFRLSLPRAEDWMLVSSVPDFAVAAVALEHGELEQLVELHGRRSLAIRVVDREGRPVPRATLLLHDLAGAPVPVDGWEGRTQNELAVGPDGELGVEGLPARPVRVSVCVPDFGEPRVFELDLADPGLRRATLRLEELDLGAERATIALALIVDPTCDAPRLGEGLGRVGEGRAYSGPVRIASFTADGRPFMTLAGTLEAGELRPVSLGGSFGFVTGKPDRLRRFSRRELPSGPAAYAASSCFEDPTRPLARLPVPARGGRVELEYGPGRRFTFPLPYLRSRTAPVELTLRLPSS